MQKIRLGDTVHRVIDWTKGERTGESMVKMRKSKYYELVDWACRLSNERDALREALREQKRRHVEDSLKAFLNEVGKAMSRVAAKFAVADMHMSAFRDLAKKGLRKPIIIEDYGRVEYEYAPKAGTLRMRDGNEVIWMRHVGYDVVDVEWSPHDDTMVVVYGDGTRVELCKQTGTVESMEVGPNGHG